MWQYVGIWRAAGNYGVALRVFARGFTCLVALASAIGVFRVVVPQLRDAFAIVQGDKGLMTLELQFSRIERPWSSTAGSS